MTAGKQESETMIHGCDEKDGQRKCPCDENSSQRRRLAEWLRKGEEKR